MALMPERVKYRKMQRGNRGGLASRGTTVAFGEFGLQAMERCWLDTKQIEAARVAITRYMKRRGKVSLTILAINQFVVSIGVSPVDLFHSGHCHCPFVARLRPRTIEIV